MGLLETTIVIIGFILWFICGYQVGKLNYKIKKKFKSE